MLNLESRLIFVEEAIRSLQDVQRQLAQRVGALEQNQWNTSGGGGFGGGGGSGVFYCQAPASGSWGATGTWPSLTPGSFTADVYQANGTSLNLIMSSATIKNWYPASPANSKVIELQPGGSGAYVTVAQSCT